MDFRQRVRRAILPAFQDHHRRLHDLRFLFLELTHACNLECVHCGSDCRKEEGGPRLEPGTILRVLQEIRGRYNPHNICVILSGGEPLCYPGLFDLGSLITRLEFPWGMVTNGYAWTGETTRRARRSGLRSITVSLDGLRESHDWFRGRKGSFARAVATISALTADPFFETMDVVTCVHQRNLAELPAIRETLQSIGVRQWRLFTVSPIGRAAGQAELFLDGEQYRRLMHSIIVWRRDPTIETSLSESGYLGPCLEDRVRDAPYFCRAGINIGGIMVNGDILACPNLDRRFAQGNVSTDSFVEAWEKKFKPFRDRRWMRSACEGCGEWNHCRGNSMHLWDPDTGRPRICHYRDYQLEGA